MTISRTVSAESLDSLAENDPSAVHSRRDLRRIHRVMGTRSIVLTALRAIKTLYRSPMPLRVLELGAGDGTLMLGVARDGRLSWPRVQLTLLDRQTLVDGATINAYAQAGWTATPKVEDVLHWARGPAQWPARWDLIVANLFMHHFEETQLAELLGAVASRSDRFFACEPRRSWPALAGSRLVGVLGANAVTRADAVLSVHAGFRATELSALWLANDTEWQLREYPAGLFSHCFFAQRRASL